PGDPADKRERAGRAGHEEQAVNAVHEAPRAVLTAPIRVRHTAKVVYKAAGRTPTARFRSPFGAEPNERGSRARCCASCGGGPPGVDRSGAAYPGSYAAF